MKSCLTRYLIIPHSGCICLADVFYLANLGSLCFASSGCFVGGLMSYEVAGYNDDLVLTGCIFSLPLIG